MTFPPPPRILTIAPLLFALTGTGNAKKPLEHSIDLCQKDSDCIVVPYRHCCGSTKRAIHKKHRKAYQANKSWQTFADPEKCAVIGICQSDKHVTEAVCRGDSVKRCQLKYK